MRKTLSQQEENPSGQTIDNFIQQEIHDSVDPMFFDISGVDVQDFMNHFKLMLIERLGIQGREEGFFSQSMENCSPKNEVEIRKTLNYVIRIKILGVLGNKLPPGTIVTMKDRGDTVVVKEVSENGVFVFDAKRNKGFTVLLLDAFLEWGDANINETHPPYIKNKIQELNRLSREDQISLQERIDEMLQYINRYKPQQEKRITSLEELSQRIDIIDRIGMIHVHHLFRSCYEMEKAMQDIDSIDHYKK